MTVLQEQQLDNNIESRLYDNNNNNNNNNNININIESRLYDPADDEFVPHVAGWNDRVEYDDDGEELEENRRVVTIARLIFFLISCSLILSYLFYANHQYVMGKVSVRELCREDVSQY